MRSLITVAVLALTLSTAGCGWHHRHHACGKAEGCPKAQACACKCPCPTGQAETPAK